MDEKLDALMTTNEVCEYLHICRKTVTRWTQDGKLTPIRIGRKCLFRKADIKRIVEQSMSVNPQ